MTPRPLPSPQGASWKERALAKSEIISDAWEVTKTWAGRLAEWVLFGCMVANIIEIMTTIPVAVSNIILGTQVVMLDVGGFSLATMGEQAREQGDDRAARKASVTGHFLIGVTIVTLLLVTVGLLWSMAKPYTDMAEKGLILVRVFMTVIYAHVIHSLRRATTHSQHVTFSEQFTEHLHRTATELSVAFTEQLERTRSEQPTRSEVAILSETVTAHEHTLAKLAALPAVLEQLRQDVEAMRQVQAERQHLPGANAIRPKLSLVETNTEYRTAKERRQQTANSESDKGAFVRSCLAETPTIRNADIQRKASERGMTISPAYISEVRKAFMKEQSA